MKKEEAFEILREKPKILPLTQKQKDVFTYLWNKYSDYASRQAIVGLIPDVYGNRARYRDLLPEEDQMIFRKIQADGRTLA